MIRLGNRDRSLALAFAIAMFMPAAHALPRDKSSDPDADAQPFIVNSYVIAPERVGDFVIDGTSYDEANKYAGAGLRYSLKGHQEIRFDVYVYPAGRMSETEAVEHGMAEFKASFGEAEKAGYYRDVRILEDSDFPLQPLDATADPTTPTDGKPGGPDAAQAALIRKLLEAERHTGQRLRLRFDLLPQDMPMYSGGYLFYKQLYFFKVRVSAASERIDEAAFQSLADQAARALVPAIQVANIGGCANVVINVDKDASPDAMAETLITQSVSHQGENCYQDTASADLATKSKDARVINIAFDAKDWQGQ